MDKCVADSAVTEFLALVSPSGTSDHYQVNDLLGIGEDGTSDVRLALPAPCYLPPRYLGRLSARNFIFCYSIIAAAIAYIVEFSPKCT